MNWNTHSRSLNLADDRGTLFLSFDRKSERRLGAPAKICCRAYGSTRIIQFCTFNSHDTTDPGAVTNSALRSTRHLLPAGWLSAGRCWADRCGWWGWMTARG